MTEILCYENSYLKEFDAIVTHVTETGIALDQTAFYPGGGGQPSDGASAGRGRSAAVVGGRDASLAGGPVGWGALE